MGSADNGPYSNKNDCFHGPTDLNLIHLISRNSTKPHSSNEISTKYCRPNVERIAHLLKQSMLSTNELEHTSSNGIVNECYQQLSRKMFDSSFIERYVVPIQFILVEKIIFPFTEALAFDREK